MEDDNNWHYRIPTAEEVKKAKRTRFINEKCFAKELSNIAQKIKK